MKSIKSAIILATAATLILGSGCKKFLDVNKDPNHPLNVSEALILLPVEITTGTEVVGGFNGTAAAYWMQQLSQNQSAPTIESYQILPADVENSWSFFLYPNIFENLINMITEAEAAGHTQYAAIGKALFAFNLAITTDLWNDIPYSQGFQPGKITQPKYDSQESIYGSVQGLLDSAIYYCNQPGSAVKPGNDDIIFNGNMAAWKKFCYFLKARFYLRLSVAPGRTAATQADSALTQLTNAFAGNGDNAIAHYTGAVQGETPWYQNTIPSAGGVVFAKSFMDSLTSRNDPRKTIFADTNRAGGYSGRPSGGPIVADYRQISTVNSFYGGYNSFLSATDPQPGTAAPLFLGTYSEQLFIQAEAVLLTQGAAAAQPIYEAAIGSHMDLLGVPDTAKTRYINSRPKLTTANALEQIITEKYVAGFLSIETYNDWRKTGFPKLQLAQNAQVPYIPRRWPYTNTEVQTNPQPQQKGVTLASHVWWDTRTN